MNTLAIGRSARLYNLIPEGSTYENAPHFHYEICSKLDELNFNITKRIGWSVPRGHAKSAYLSNIFPVHQIVFNKRRYISSFRKLKAWRVVLLSG